jgi:hypothetical protein
MAPSLPSRATGAASRRLAAALRSGPARTLFLLLALAAIVTAIAGQWQQLGDAVSRVRAADLAAAMGFGLLYLLCAAAAWRTIVADLGGALPAASAARIFFLGQIGKYLPGGIWSFAAVAELGRDAGLPRSRTVATLAVALLVSLATGALLALLLLPIAGGSVFARYWWVAPAAPLALLALCPAVLGRLFAMARIELGREPSLGGMAAASAWSLAGWMMAGLQIWLLLGAVGAPLGWATLALTTAGYALAWVVGFLVMVAPAGLGPREAVLTLVLAAIVAPGEALLVALLARLLGTAADLAAAGAVLLAPRRTAPAA